MPGSVHTDLQSAKVIDDPYYFDIENKIKWVSTTDFKYSCDFEITAEMNEYEHIELVFDGLDTVTRISLNGMLIGQTANMFCQHRFNVKPYLNDGFNELEIIFYSPINYCVEQQKKHGKLAEPGFGKAPSMFMRKMDCNFGGDWAPNMPTSGIFQPVYLQIWNHARMQSVRPLIISADEHQAVIDLKVDLDADFIDNLELQIELTGPDGNKLEWRKPVNCKETGNRITINAPYLWWPRGYGEQYLYDLTVELRDGNAGCVFDGWQKKIGIRQVNLNTEKDDIGSKFNVEINGRMIFCKGANFIPNDFFVDRITEQDYRLRLAQMAGANMNMLRIWGGGFYENDIFYDLCDELGFLVWQDFMCGGLPLPEHDDMIELFDAEARYQVARLSYHPCIVLWCGGNESIIHHFERWSGLAKKKYDEFFDTPRDVIKNDLKGRPWGNVYYNDLFPEVVRELDPSRPYWPSSSYSGSMDINPLDENHGDIHIWKVCKKLNYNNYRGYHPRFVSEFGFQSPSAYTTLTECMPQEEVDFDTKGIMQRERYPRWIKNSNGHVLEYFDQPKEFDAWNYLMQIRQARAIDCAAGWFRSQYPNCTGLLYWQLNDCWPVLSWSAIDFYNRKKPLYYATGRFFADMFITIEPDGKTLSIFAHNDSDKSWDGTINIEKRHFNGAVLEQCGVDFSVARRTCSKIVVLNDNFVCPSDSSSEFLYVSADKTWDTWFFEVDKNLDYPEPDFDAKLVKSQTGYELTITAKTLIRDIVLTPERIDPKAQISDGMITLLPGQDFVFNIESDSELTLEQIINYLVFWCANYFGKSIIKR